MFAMAVQYECWGGPADGITVTLDADLIHLDYIYIRLPLRGDLTITKVPPATPYCRYKLGVPKESKCQWAGTWLS